MSPLPPWHWEVFVSHGAEVFRADDGVEPSALKVLNEDCEPTSQNVCSANGET